MKTLTLTVTVRDENGREETITGSDICELSHKLLQGAWGREWRKVVDDTGAAYGLVSADSWHCYGPDGA